MLKNRTETLNTLNGLYERFGYRKYKMSKFEEYEFYMNHKDFLISSSVLTFTDPGGKLMALKPDVTLSIIKNNRCADGELKKLYYCENVYRTAGDQKCFKEISQTGLECFGDVDHYSICEVIGLAANSLGLLGPRFELDISNPSLLEAAFKHYGIPADVSAKAFRLLSAKNIGGLKMLFESTEIDQNISEKLTDAASLEISAENASDILKSKLGGLLDSSETEALDELISAADFLGRQYPGAVKIDFSLTEDTRYYSGIVFKGYLDGVPTAVLSGGQYDGLMKKLSKNAKAIGFAMYLDLLDPLYPDDQNSDSVSALLYDGDCAPYEIYGAVQKLSVNGERIKAVKSPHDESGFRHVYHLRKGGRIR